MGRYCAEMVQVIGGGAKRRTGKKRRRTCSSTKVALVMKRAEGSAGLFAQNNGSQHHGGVERRYWRKQKSMRGCWPFVKQRGKNGQHTGNVMRKCGTRRTNLGGMRSRGDERERCRGSKECDLEQGIKNVQVGCDGIHLKVLQDLKKREENLWNSWRERHMAATSLHNDVLPDPEACHE